MSNYLTAGFNGSSGNLSGYTSDDGSTWVVLLGTRDPKMFTTLGGIVANSGAGGSGASSLCRSSVISPSADVSNTTNYVYDSVSFAFIGQIERMNAAGTQGYLLAYSQASQKWEIWHLDGTDAPTNQSSFAASASTSIYTSGATPSVVYTVTGTNPVHHKLVVDGTTLIDYDETGAGRVTTAGYPGLYIRSGTAEGQGMFINSMSGDTVTISTPVSFSGSVPTRNGIIGTVASFANAGFFAGTATPFAYTNVGTALPAGLTLSLSTGIISGTPTTAATTSGIIVRATDTASNVANTNSYSIVIAATNASPTFPGSISNISGTNGSAIAPVNVSGQFSDTDALAYSASPSGTAWPAGIMINSSTGIISGTSSTTATTTGCKVRATDTASQTVDSNTFNFVIAAVSTATFAASGQLKNLNGGILPDGSYSVIIRSKTNLTAVPLVVKTGLAMISGVIPTFSITGPVAGTEYIYEPVSEADSTIRGLARATPT